MTMPHDLACAAGAALVINAVPHGLAEVVGKPFPSPFAKPPGVGLSGRVPNLVWSAANAAAGVALLRGRDGSVRERAVVAVSGVLTAAALTAYFGKLGVRPV